MEDFSLYGSSLKNEVKHTLASAKEMMLQLSVYEKEIGLLTYENAYVSEEVDKAMVTYERLEKLDGLLSKEGASEAILDEAKFIEDLTGLKLGDLTKEGTVKDGLKKIWEAIKNAAKFVMKKLRNGLSKLKKIFDILTEKAYVFRNRRRLLLINTYNQHSHTIQDVIRSDKLKMEISKKEGKSKIEVTKSNFPSFGKELEGLGKVSLKLGVVNSKVDELIMESEGDTELTVIKNSPDLPDKLTYEEASKIGEFKFPSEETILHNLPYLAVKNFEPGKVISIEEILKEVEKGTIEKILKDTGDSIKNSINTLEKCLKDFNPEPLLKLDISNANYMSVIDRLKYKKIKTLNDLIDKDNVHDKDAKRPILSELTAHEPNISPDTASTLLTGDGKKKIEKLTTEIINTVNSKYDKVFNTMKFDEDKISKEFVEAVRAVDKYVQQTLMSMVRIGVFYASLDKLVLAVYMVQSSMTLNKSIG